MSLLLFPAKKKCRVFDAVFHPETFQKGQEVSLIIILCIIANLLSLSLPPFLSPFPPLSLSFPPSLSPSLSLSLPLSLLSLPLSPLSLPLSPLSPSLEPSFQTALGRHGLGWY